MKRVYFLISLIAGLMLSAQLFGQKMAGTYVIGIGGDYTTIQAAVLAMESTGISAAVVFNIKDGTYNESVSMLDTIDGVSAVNTITFQSQSNDSSKVIIENANVCWNVSSNAGNMIFNNLTFRQTGVTANPVIFFITDILEGGMTLKINKCYVQALSNTNGVLLQIQGGDWSIASVDIQNSKFSGGATSMNISTYDTDGIYDETISNVLIKNNTLSAGIYLQSVSDINKVQILNNINTQPNPNNYGIYFNSNNGSVSNVKINKAKITTTNSYTVYCYANQKINGFVIDSSKLTSTNSYSVYLNSGNHITGTNIRNSSITGGTNSIYLYTQSDIDSTTMYNDSLLVTVNSNRTLYMYANANINNTIIDKVYSNSTGTYRYGFYIYAYGQINNCSIKNSKVFSYYYAMYIRSYQDMKNVSFENDSIVASNDYAVRTRSSYSVSNIQVEKSVFKGSSYGFYSYCYNAYKNIKITNSTFEANSYPVYMYADLKFSNMEFTRNKVNGVSYGVYLSSDISMDSLRFDRDTIKLSNSGYAVNLQTSYESLSNVSITNSKLSNQGSYVIYMYSNNELNNIVIENDSIIKGSTVSTWGYGIYLESYIGQANNVLINSNKILVGNAGYGIYMYIPGKNVKITNNTISTKPADYQYYAIQLYGEDEVYNNKGSVTIANNIITGTRYTAIYTELLNGTTIIKNNTISSSNNDYLIGVQTYEMVGGKLEIANNSITNENGSSNGNAALYLDWRTSPDTGLVYNNMCSGEFDYGLYLDEVSNMNIMNNSFSIMLPDSNYSMSYIESLASKNTITNNIFSMYGTVGKMYTLADYDVVKNNAFKNNMYNRLKDSVSFVYVAAPYDHFDSLSIWQKSQKKDSLSFLKKPSFVDDTTNLHIKCGSTGYNVATKNAVVAYDFDGQPRSASTPSIGADEVLSGTSNVTYAEREICGNSPIILDAGFFEGASYAWSNSKTGQTTTVSAPGTYTVDITGSGCGTIAGSFTVKAIQPVADFTHMTSYLTAVFTGKMEKAESFIWNFGDGTTSKEENPIHVYPANASYTATLTVYAHCDTVSKSVTIDMSYVNMKEVLENATIYPNPAVDNVTISFGTTIENALVQIVSLDGAQVASQELFNTSEISINVASYPAGIYLVKVTAAEHTTVKKIIKE